MPTSEQDKSEKQAILDFFQSQPTGFFIEVGANDPCALSQTWPLEQQGWTGLLIEPMEAYYQKLVSARPRSRVVRAACSSPDKRGTGTLHVGQYDVFSALQTEVDDTGVDYVRTESVPLVTLDDVLAEQPPARVDFVSIDVEGMELDVLRGFDLKRWQPQLVLMEDKLNSLDKHHHLLANGYRLLRRTDVNSWYVPRGHPAKAPLGERLRLWRKCYLGLPFRQFKNYRRRRAHRDNHPAK